MCGDKPFRDNNWLLWLTSPQLVKEEYVGKRVEGVYSFSLGFCLNIFLKLVCFLVISFPLLGQSF